MIIYDVRVKSCRVTEPDANGKYRVVFAVDDKKERQKLIDAIDAEWEENKLKFAKFAYQFTYDQGNYFKVSQVFEWEDSIEELNDYISR